MKYTPDQKRKLVLRYQSGESVSDICTQTGIARSTLYSWLKPYQTTITEAGMVVTPKEFSALKKRVEKLEGIIQVLKSVDCTVSAPLQDKLKALEYILSVMLWRFPEEPFTIIYSVTRKKTKAISSAGQS